ncbi:MAG: TetM/TetW/TetO/TetS family tetracycline resistance ribosomal protection protein [Clostridia bacterium]|nr:TetM/TetW/TetO/TetS family tetracycline resistance ribosomal protection protein [Clostridia bacterium]
MAKGAIIGLAAHVDAGKTTLSESLLYLSGAVRRQGRVDHGDAFLDTDRMEKERGITIFSKQALLTWKKKDLTLVDTPGHTDFSGETERVMGILDATVLVISAIDGVQSHTRTLWTLLEKNQVPVIVFVNKMDRYTGAKEEICAHLARQLSDQIVDFTAEDQEKIALSDETCLDYYLREGKIPFRRIEELVRRRRLFPCFFGSALQNEGVKPLLDFLADYDPGRAYPADFGAQVYKVARDPQGARLTFMKVTGGALKVRDLLTLRDGAGEAQWSEKAAELRLYSGARYTAVQQAEAGQLCCVVGLSKALPGDGLGIEQERKDRLLQPCYACRLLLPAGTDIHYALDCLRAMEEEEPLMQVEYVEGKREIRIHSMGDVYLEVLRRQLKDRFGIDAGFSEGSVLYRETIASTVEGVGHYEPLRHYAEVHVLLSPLPPGSGLRFDTAVSTDDLALNWQRLILTHMKEKPHLGVLTGSPVTDLRITLVNGRAHLKHTEGGDFRQATYRAIRQGLMKAKPVLLEPYLTLEITVPEENLGRAMSDMSMMGGQFDAPEDMPDGLKKLTAVAPAAACAAYGRQVSVYTRGRGRMAASFYAYQPCAHPEAVVAERGYDPERDVNNTPDSVFCAHGAGFTVKWDEVEQYMHLPLQKEIRDQQRADQAARAAEPVAYHGTAEEDRELMAIFERTYGPVKSRQLFAPVSKAGGGETAGEKQAFFQREILLVDGYNVLFAWEELKALAQQSIDSARVRLMDLMCNFGGVTGKEIILVFDAYKVPGNPGSVEKYSNIFVIYTRETQTADAFIEKTTYEGRGSARIRVVTSDGPEQLIALGNQALRTSAREFKREVVQAQGSIADFLEKLNRLRPDNAIERAYKEAWKQKKEKQQEGKNRGEPV